MGSSGGGGGDLQCAGPAQPPTGQVEKGRRKGEDAGKRGERGGERGEE